MPDIVHDIELREFRGVRSDEVDDKFAGAARARGARRDHLGQRVCGLFRSGPGDPWNVGLWQCAPKARIISGGGIHPESCRLIR
jgi:hypothetical protein